MTINITYRFINTITLLKSENVLLFQTWMNPIALLLSTWFIKVFVSNPLISSDEAL